MTTLPELTEPQIRRYARHIVLAEIGGVGQARLIAAPRAGDRRGRAGRTAPAVSRRRRHRHPWA